MKIRIIFKSEVLANQNPMSGCQIINYSSIDELSEILNSMTDKLSINFRAGVEIKLYSTKKNHKNLEITASNLDRIISTAQLWQDDPDIMENPIAVESILRKYKYTTRINDLNLNLYKTAIMWSIEDHLPDADEVEDMEYMDGILRIFTTDGGTIKLKTTI